MDGDILKQRYYAYYEKNSPVVRIDLTLNYNSYDEMSDYVRALLDDGTPFDEVAFQTHTHTYFVDFTYLLGNLIASENPFECLQKLFIGASEKMSNFFVYQLKGAEKIYKEYISYNNFTLDFLSVFANEKRININQKLYEVLNNRFFPLKIDSKTEKIFYGYESTDIKDIIFSTIHFALSDGYKLVKCKHCERWFFTQTLKEEFCKRKSPCSDLEVDGKKLLGKEQPCKIAVDTIKKRLQGRKKSIYDKWKNGNFVCEYKCEECPYSDCIVDDERCHRLCENYKRLRKNINSSPTVDNIIKLHRYLYSDEMPKQERPNRRKSNEEKRRSKEI